MKRSLTLFTVALILCLAGASVDGAADEATGTVTLRLGGHVKPVKGAEDTLRKLAVDFVRSSNFNTVAHTRVLNLTVPMIQEHYRRVIAGDYLVVTCDRPVTIRTVGGDVSMVEIVIGLNRPDYADALFTIDSQARVVEHGKYSGGIGIDLRRAVNAAVGR